MSAPGFRDYQERTRSFSSMAVESGWNANLTGVGDPTRLQGSQVTGRLLLDHGRPGRCSAATMQPGEDSSGAITWWC